MLFKGKRFVHQEIWDMHLLRISWWVKGSWHDCPYDLNQFLLNFCNIRVKRQVAGPREAAWSPPSLVVLNFNVDGASKGNLGLCGVGGVLHNSDEEALGYFFKNLDGEWAFEDEVRAIFLALLLCHQCGFSSVIIESDSTTNVGWVNSSLNRPSKLRNELNQIDYLFSEVNCMGVHHIYREAIDFADHLAKEGWGRPDALWFCSEL